MHADRERNSQSDHMMDNGAAGSDRSARYPSPESSVPARRACDACRARKIRCNRGQPCSHCVQVGISCTNEPRPREKRARILLSAQYEQKIDHLEQRLDLAIGLLEQLTRTTTTTTTTTAAQLSSRTSLYSSAYQTDNRSPHVSQVPVEHSHLPLPLPPPPPPPPPPPVASSSTPTTHVATDGELQQDADGATVVEGDSSLGAQSAFASNFVNSLISSGSPVAAPSLDMRQTLDVLSRIVATLKRPKAASEMTYPLNLNPRGPPPRRGELPPIDKTMALVSAACNDSLKHLHISMHCYNALTMDEFALMCHYAYFSEAQSVYDYIIVLSGLSSLFWMHAHAVPAEEKEEYLRYDRMCHVCLETALSGLPLHLPARPNVIAALVMGAYYSIEISKPSLAWVLTCKATEVCQTLGYNNAATMHEDPPKKVQHKLILFWVTYHLDRCLSLRLGRPSTIPQWSITVPLPSATEGNSVQSWGFAYLRIYVESARCQGDIYEMLYSPEAVTRPADERRNRVHYLAAEIQRLEDSTQRFNDKWYEDIGAAIGTDLLDFNNYSEEVLRSSLLTLIYRAEPRPAGSLTTFSAECVHAARTTLERHQLCMSVIGKNKELFFPLYVYWILLFAPFIPFIVLFCQVIETREQSDLVQMQAFIHSTQAATALTSEADKMHLLFQALYNVASHYVQMSQAQTQTGLGLGHESESVQMNDYMAALGFANMGSRGGGPDGGGQPVEVQSMPDGDQVSMAGQPPLQQQDGSEMAWMMDDWLHNNQAMMELMQFSDYIVEDPQQ